MFKKIGATLLCASGLLCVSNTFATTEHALTLGLSTNYEFPTNVPQIFSNVFFRSVNATCVVTSNDTANHYVDVKMLHNSGGFNGVKLNEGDVTGALTQPGDVLHISASPGARVELINRGPNTIKARCSVD